MHPKYMFDCEGNNEEVEELLRSIYTKRGRDHERDRGLMTFAKEWSK